MATDNSLNTIHINTFSGGMDTDSSDAMIKSTSYRMAHNLRYVTDTKSSNGQLRKIDGAFEILTLNIANKYVLDNLALSGSLKNLHVIGTATIRNVGIIIYGDSNGWSLYTFNSDEDNPTYTKVFGRCIEPLLEPISIVTRWEDNDNVKAYVADGKHKLLLILLNRQYENSDINSITSIPYIDFKKPIFCGLTSGTLKGGLVQYSYLLYNKHGALSDMSPQTRLIPLYKGPLDLTDTVYGYEAGTASDKGVVLKFPISKSYLKSFPYIKVWRILYIESGQLPMIQCVYDAKPKMTDDYFEFADHGNTVIENITLEEYNSMTGVHVIPRVIESKNDYLFAANIKSDSELDLDLGIMDWDASKNVTWKFVIGNMLGDNNTKDLLAIRYHGLDLRTVSVKNDDGSFVEEALTDFQDYLDPKLSSKWSYANPATCYYMKSLRRGEVYRYGIVLYDNYGNASSVKWIADIEVPNVYEDGFNTFETKDDGFMYVKPIGIKFTVNNIPQLSGVLHNIIKYEIVRCGRTSSDIRSISQGIVSRPIRRWVDITKDAGISSNYPLTPSGFMTVSPYLVFTTKGSNGFTMENGVFTTSATFDDKDTEFLFAASNNQINNDRHRPNYDKFQFASPEVCYSDVSLLQLIKNNNTKLSVVDYVYGKSSSGYTQRFKFVISNDDTYNMFYEKDGVIKNEDDLAELNKITNRQTYIKLYDQKFNVNLRYTKDAKINNRQVSEQLPEDPWVYDVKGFVFPDTMGWDDFASKSSSDNKVTWSITAGDKLSAIGDDNYCNWVFGGYYGLTMNLYNSNDTTHVKDVNSEMIGPGGKTMVLNINASGASNISSSVEPGFGTFVCNLCQQSVPYGGNDDVTKSLNVYYSYGDIFDVTDNNSHIVFDGDTFIIPFEYVSMHKWQNSYVKGVHNACIIYAVPLETSMNLAYTYGYEFSKNINSSKDISKLLVSAANVNNEFVQDTPLYLYNGVYSQNQNSRFMSAYPLLEEISKDSYDYRVFSSNLKTNNERTDSWLKFMPNNFIDVDTRNGQITQLRTFNNLLIFWQEKAAGVLSVNERVVLQDLTNQNLMLGSGGVLDRYDYFATSNGMKAFLFADAQSDSTLYWWDDDKHEIVAYSERNQPIVLSKIKSVLTYLNRHRDVVLDNPCLFYDKRFNELIAKITDDCPIVYNEQTLVFTGLYYILPKFVMSFSKKTLLSVDGSIVEWNKKGGTFDSDISFVVNPNPQYTKVFDNGEWCGQIGVKDLDIAFNTPLNQTGKLERYDLYTDREGNYKYHIPRDNDADYGSRLRGKTMNVLMHTSNDEFALDWVMTKYRISWT